MPDYCKLKSGIEIVTDPAPACETLSVSVAFRVGSCDEGDAPHGIAHFLEHMAFKGTTKRSAVDISDEITGRGGYLNATTDWDTTSFTCTTLSEELERALDVLADIVISPRLAEDDINLERNVILQEMEQRKGTWATLEECFYASAYAEQDLARPIIGTEEGLRVIDGDDLRAFMDKHYVTGNLIVAVAGNARHEDVVELVGDKFASLRSGQRNPMPVYEYHGGEQGFACSCEQGIVRYGFEAPRHGDQEAYAAAIFRAIAAVGPSSRMFQELREKQGLVYDTEAWPTHHCGNSLTTFSTTGHATKIRDIFLRMHESLVGITENLDQNELDRMRRSLMASDRMQRDNVISRTANAVFQLVSDGRLSTQSGEQLGYEAVTVEDVMAYGRRMLASAPTLAVHGPARGMPKLANLKTTKAKSMPLRVA